MSKKRWIVLIWIVIIILIILFMYYVGYPKIYDMYASSYNEKAEQQRNSITYCSQDEDCIMQEFYISECGFNYPACFNKLEQPLDDIQLKRPQYMMCDPNFNCEGTCECVKGKCQEKCLRF